VDVAVFGPLKAKYRAQLNNCLSGLTSDSVAGKRAFLECYRRARIYGMTKSNIKAGWKASGLWPVSLRKPLNNSLVIKNSNGCVSTVAPTPSTGLESFNNPILGKNSEDQPVWFTPKKAKDFSAQGERFLRGIKRTASERLFMRKAYKGFDNMAFQLATIQQQLQAAQEDLERARGRKRRRVEIDPNKAFAGINEIRRAQRLAAGEDITDSEFSEEEDSETASCIDVAI